MRVPAKGAIDGLWTGNKASRQIGPDFPRTLSQKRVLLKGPANVAEAALLLNDAEKEVPNRAAIERAGFCIIFSNRNHVYNVMWRQGERDNALYAVGLQEKVPPKRVADRKNLDLTRSRPGRSFSREQQERNPKLETSRAELRAARFLEANRRAQEISVRRMKEQSAAKRRKVTK